ncbi:hypothetical protein D3C86_1558030 [compost metagenome]
MLANVGGDNGAVIHAGRDGVNQAVMAQRVTFGWNGARELLLQLSNQGAPFGVVGGVGLRDQLGQHFAHIALNRHVRLFDFTQLGAVDIDVNDFRVRAELLGFANRPVIKTCAKNDQ